MTLTVAQTVALEALEVAFGPSEITAAHVKVRELDGYIGGVERYAKYVLDGYACYKLASDPDFAEAQRKALAEEQRIRMEKLAERADGVRDAVVIGFLSGLMAKMSKKFPEAEISFDMNEACVMLLVEKEGHELQVTYYRHRKEVYTLIEDVEYTEDVTHIRGSVSPREQLNGFAALLDFLEADRG